MAQSIDTCLRWLHGLPGRTAGHMHHCYVSAGKSFPASIVLQAVLPHVPRTDGYAPTTVRGASIQEHARSQGTADCLPG